MPYLIGYIVAWLLFGLVTGFIAKSKGYGFGWFFLGFLLGIIGVFIVLALKDVSLDKEKNKITSQKKWQCPKCGHINPERNKFCANCGEDFYPEYIVVGEKWTCGRCQTVNESYNKYCVHCGLDKSTAINEFEQYKETEQYVEENGEECEVCGKKALKLYNVKIVDDLGVRYRKACEKCIKKYNAVVIDEK